MRPDLIEVGTPEDTLGEVADRMTVVVKGMVVKDYGRLIGILTERDMLKAMAARVHTSEARAPVDARMTRSPLQRIEADAAARLMLEHGFRHLPVVDDGGRVTGVISLALRRRHERRQPGLSPVSRRPRCRAAARRPPARPSRASS